MTDTTETPRYSIDMSRPVNRSLVAEFADLWARRNALKPEVEALQRAYDERNRTLTDLNEQGQVLSETISKLNHIPYWSDERHTAVLAAVAELRGEAAVDQLATGGDGWRDDDGLPF